MAYVETRNGGDTQKRHMGGMTDSMFELPSLFISGLYK